MQQYLVALVFGGLSVLSFAPFSWWAMGFISLGGLVWLLSPVRRVRQGFLIAYCWALGGFLGGISWLYVALHMHGGLPAAVAALAVLLFCGFLSIYAGLAGALFARMRHGAAIPDALLLAALWTLSEWLRGWIFTGFPWLATGYAHVPESPLAGFFPIVGVYGVGFVAMLVAALAISGGRRQRRSLRLALLCGILLVGWGSSQIRWTEPAGDPLEIALIQTNIEQGLKWQPEMLQRWLDINLEFVEDHPAQLVVLPETTLPVFIEDLPPGYLEALAAPVREVGGNLIFGVFQLTPDGEIHNAAVSIGAERSQWYAKQHLVPFGEYSPPMFDWFYRLINLPMSNQTPGPRNPPPMELSGQKIGINICYEDLFGEESIAVLPETTLLLNLSNLAWYGRSFAQPQHLQIAQARALEAGRPMLRSTNTGKTAIVGADGRVIATLPQFEAGVLRGVVRGHQGTTPYMMWGNLPAVWLSLLLLVATLLPHLGSNRLREARAS